MEPLTVAVAAAVIIAIVELVKRTVAAWTDPGPAPNPDRYAPALSVALGLAAGAVGWVDVGALPGDLLAGLLAGLTATGAYGGTKATAQASRGS